jgi:hypothetical protein
MYRYLPVPQKIEKKNYWSTEKKYDDKLTALPKQ